MLFSAGFSQAEENSDVVLTFVGQKAGDEGARVYTMSYAELYAFPEQRIQTSTQVTYGSHIFSGPLIRNVLDKFNFVGDTVRLEALNGYIIDVPLSDFRRFDAIFAHSMSGLRLSVRHFGPVWVVYPRDSLKELQDIRYDMRWVWQLRTVVVYDSANNPSLSSCFYCDDASQG
ncbi:hypothetical protein ACLPHM_13480 [Paenalcaligenes sp. Me131]|uniref:molybdopterin-dependent oxidoreductase n=1 Tax=Paenalcaligenes sp. Me131 TaxID=3392636 RepID=UPI003D29D794